MKLLAMLRYARRRLLIAAEISLFALRGARGTRLFLSQLLLLYARMRPARGESSIAEAWRLADSFRTQQETAIRLQKYVGVHTLPSLSDEELKLPYTLMLAAPRNDRRGLLFTTVQEDLSTALNSTRFGALAQQFDWIFCTPWSPPSPQPYLRAAMQSKKARIWLGISHPDDERRFRSLHANIAPLPVLASDWLDPEDFACRDALGRDIDILMVAGWQRYKRHWALLTALRRLDKGLRVVLVGGGGVDAMKTIQRAAVELGVEQDIAWHNAIPGELVHSFQARSRVAVQTSWREGTCVAVAEAMMSGAPVVMTADSHIGTAARINPSTGLLVARNDLAHGVSLAHEGFDAFLPRRWCEENAASAISFRRLIESLNDHADKDRGSVHGEDALRPKWRVFRPYYADLADRRLRDVDESRKELLSELNIRLAEGK